MLARCGQVPIIKEQGESGQQPYSVSAMHFADRLLAAVKAKGTPLCVGLDPRWECLPDEIRSRHGTESLDKAAAACEEFCLRVLDIVGPLVPAVKPQSAFFEALGPRGMIALQRILRSARDKGLVTIMDGKRNDIASTAAAYADAAFGGVKIGKHCFRIWDADAITVNPYLGRDAVEPFLETARRDARGVFVLVRTSNPGGGQFQDLPAAGRPLYQQVGAAVEAWTRENLGASGYGDVGAVVGATHKNEMALLREQLPGTLFLVPGLGAQGASAEDVAPAFADDGRGAIVNSARAINFPFKPHELDWERQIANVTQQTIAELAEATRTRKAQGQAKAPSAN